MPALVALAASLALLIGLAAALQPKATLLLGAALAGSVALYALRRHYLVVTLLLLWFIPPQTAPGGLLAAYPAARWAGVLLIPALAGAMLARDAMRKRSLTLPPFTLPLLAVAALILISALVNHSDVVDTLGSFLLYLRYPVFAIAVLNSGVSETRIRSLTRWFLALVALAIPEVVVRYALGGTAGDSVSWSLGPWGHRDLGIYCVYALCLLAAKVSSRGLRPALLVFMALLFVPALLGEIKALLLFGPICVGLVLLVAGSLSRTIARRTLAGLVVGVTAAVVLMTWATSWQGSNNTVQPLVAQVRQLASGTTDSTQVLLQMNRIGPTIRATQALQEADQLALGAGPGSSLAGTATGRPGQLTEVLSWGVTQVSAAVWDIGLVGVAAIMTMLITVLPAILRTARGAANPATREVGAAMFGMWVFYALLGPQYDLVWRIDSSSFLFWTLLAYILARQSHWSRMPE